MIAAGEQRGARGGAQAGGVELAIRESRPGDAVRRRRPHPSSVGARPRVPHVVEEDEDDVRRAGRRLRELREVGPRLVVRPAELRVREAMLGPGIDHALVRFRGVLLERLEQPERDQRRRRQHCGEHEELIRGRDPEAHRHPEADRRRQPVHLAAVLDDRTRADEPDPADERLEDARLGVDVIAKHELRDLEVGARPHGEQGIGADPRPDLLPLAIPSDGDPEDERDREVEEDPRSFRHPVLRWAASGLNEPRYRDLARQIGGGSAMLNVTVPR